MTTWLYLINQGGFMFAFDCLSAWLDLKPVHSPLSRFPLLPDSLSSYFQLWWFPLFPNSFFLPEYISVCSIPKTILPLFPSMLPFLRQLWVVLAVEIRCMLVSLCVHAVFEPVSPIQPMHSTCGCLWKCGISPINCKFNRTIMIKDWMFGGYPDLSDTPI